MVLPKARTVKCRICMRKKERLTKKMTRQERRGVDSEPWERARQKQRRDCMRAYHGTSSAITALRLAGSGHIVRWKADTFPMRPLTFYLKTSCMPWHMRQETWFTSFQRARRWIALVVRSPTVYQIIQNKTSWNQLTLGWCFVPPPSIPVTSFPCPGYIHNANIERQKRERRDKKATRMNTRRTRNEWWKEAQNRKSGFQPGY